MAGKLDQLGQVEYHFSDPRSPIFQSVRKQLSPLEQQAAKLDPKSPEYAQLREQYNAQASQLMLGEMSKLMGGAIPTREEALKEYYAGQPESGGAVAEGARRPYESAYNIIEQLQRISGQNAQKPPAQLANAVPTAAGGGAPPTVSKPRIPAKMPALKQGASDDEKLSEAQMMLLYNLAGANKPQYAETAAQADEAPLMGGLPPMPTQDDDLARSAARRPR